MSFNSVSVTLTNNIDLPQTKTIITQDIKTEARRRIAEEEAKQKALENELRIKAQHEAEEKARIYRNELVRLEAEKIQARLLAEKMVLEAEAQKATELREAQIKAEIERLKNRTPQEIMEEEIAFLRAKVSKLEAKLNF